MKGDIVSRVGVGTVLLEPDLIRICRDLAWSEMAAMPGLHTRLGPRLNAAQAVGSLDWSSSGLALDSLACMELATVAATWCNAFEVGFEDSFLAKRNVIDWAATMGRVHSKTVRGPIFSTSATTGKRQHICHDLSTLMSEAHSWAEVFAVAAWPVNRIINMVPCHHIYGFVWGVLLPKAIGVDVLDATCDTLPGLQDGDLLVGVPEQWQWLAGSSRAQPKLVRGVTSTAPILASVHRNLISSSSESSAYLAGLIQVYGSTQTGGIAWRDSPDKPYMLAPGRTRNISGNVELMRPDGSTVQFELQDAVNWTDINEFELLRRVDTCVQVGGHNVSTSWVREQLLSYPGVLDASVRLDTQAQFTRLKAFVVMTDWSDSKTQMDLQAFIAQNLPWYATFSSIVFGAELPRNVMGKPSDWQV